jgi:hypothetical protein
MEKVKPLDSLLPKIGQEVRFYVGEPVEIEPYITEQRRLLVPEEEIRKGIMEILTKEMLKVKGQCEDSAARAITTTTSSTITKDKKA